MRNLIVYMYFKIERFENSNACDSDSRCGLACDARSQRCGSRSWIRRIPKRTQERTIGGVTTNPTLMLLQKYCDTNGRRILIEISVDISDIFNFFCAGGGKGESKVPGIKGGGGVVLKNVGRGGGLSGEGGGGPKGGEGVCRAFPAGLLPNGLNKDKEVIASSFKIRRLGLRPLKTPYFLGQNSLRALPSTSLNEEVVTSLSYLSRLAATGS